MSFKGTSTGGNVGKGSGIKRSGGKLAPSTAMPTKSQRRAGVRSGQKGIKSLNKGPLTRGGAK